MKTKIILTVMMLFSAAFIGCLGDEEGGSDSSSDVLTSAKVINWSLHMM